MTSKGNRCGVVGWNWIGWVVSGRALGLNCQFVDSTIYLFIYYFCWCYYLVKILSLFFVFVFCFHGKLGLAFIFRILYKKIIFLILGMTSSLYLFHSFSNYNVFYIIIVFIFMFQLQ